MVNDSLLLMMAISKHGESSTSNGCCMPQDLILRVSPIFRFHWSPHPVFSMMQPPDRGCPTRNGPSVVVCSPVEGRWAAWLILRHPPMSSAIQVSPRDNNLGLCCFVACCYQLFGHTNIYYWELGGEYLLQKVYIFCVDESFSWLVACLDPHCC